jgi:ferritin-like metal-binding protein YciE
MKLNSLQELYIEQLQDLHSAETQLVEALPKMVASATAPELRQAFDMHLNQTKTHVLRLEQILRDLDQRATGKTCKAMQGLIAEGKDLMRERGDAAVLDAGMIAAAQRIEHYEIAGYGCARTYATQLGRSQDAQLLEQTLAEEKSADSKLTTIAESTINIEAM